MQNKRADYHAYLASGEQSALQEIHRLQLLQMALEKLSKAFLYHGEPAAKYSHHVVQSAVNRLKAHAIANAAGMDLVNFCRLLDLARPIFLQIEAASPSVGFDGSGLTREESERTANVEYPWQSDVNDPNSWIAPVSSPPAILHALRYDRRSIAATRLLGRLIDVANVILP